MTSTLPDLHASFVARLCAAAASDPRFDALLAGGSFIHGGLDEHSDLDFVLVCTDADYDAVLRDRHAFACSLGTLVSAFTGEHVGEPRLLICLYGPPLLHVDLKFVKADDLDARIERPATLYARDPAGLAARLDRAVIAWPDQDADWFEARVWVWLHYAATKVGRGELFEAIGMLAFLREQVLGPMLYRRAGKPQRGVRRIEMTGLDADGRLAATIARHDREQVRQALLAAAELYLDLRADAPPAQAAPAMPQALYDIISGSGSALPATTAADRG